MRQQGFSHLNEEKILAKYIDALLPSRSRGTVVDIGAGNGIRRSNTYSLFRKGWKGVGIEADDRRFALLKRAYKNLPNAVACKARVNRENVVPLLHSVHVEKDFSVLSLDIDGNDYWILNAILAEFRPSLIVTEINEKIPPPIRFVVKYDPDFHLRHHFYGYSTSALMDLCKRYDYGLLELEYNNAFIAPAELAGDRFVDPQIEYAKGYRDRPDRKRQFPLNFEMEELLSMTPEEGLQFIEQFYKNEAGNYYASMSPIDEPA